MLDACILTADPFRPPWYLRSGHVQTILTGFYRPLVDLPAPIVHRIPIDGFGHVLVHENSSPDPKAEGVLLLHGMGSNHAGTYMTHLARSLMERGFRVFRADLPGAGPSGDLTPLPPHGACFEEVWGMLTYLSRTLSIRRWRLAGISLGGNILLRMLATKRALIDAGDGSGLIAIDRAVAVAPPIRLSDCSRHMERGLFQIYAKYFLRSLRHQAVYRGTIWPQWADRLKHASFKSIRTFDETVTAPLAGFRSAEEYYATGSSAAWLDQIEVPTSVLIDDHDPIVPAWMFASAQWSASTTLFRTRHGGHVGYLQRARAPRLRSGPIWKRWADNWIADEIAR